MQHLNSLFIMHMKRYILATLALLVGTIVVTAQSKRTFRIDIDRNSFDYYQQEDGSVHITSSEYEHYIEEGNLPAIPYRLLFVLLPDQEKFSTFTYRTGTAAYKEEAILAPNPIFGHLENGQTGNNEMSYPIKDYPFEIRLDEERIIDGYHIACLLLPAFSYDAISQTITWISHVDITIETSPLTDKETHQGTMNTLISSIIINPEDFGKENENWMPASIDIAEDGKQWDLSRVLLHNVPYVYMGKQWIDGDTLVDGKLCKKLYTLTTTEDERIEQKEVLEVGYCRQEGDKFYKNGVLMFDFGLKEGEIFSFEEEDVYAIVTHVGDTILADGIVRKYLTLKNYHPEWNITAMVSDKWIEGIGSLKMGIYDNMFMAGGYNTTLLSCTHNNAIIYEYENSKQINTLYPDTPQCNIQTTSSTLLCTAPNAVKLEVYTMDAIKVGEARFVEGEATVKVGEAPAMYLYVVTYPDGRRKNGKAVKN